MNKTILITGGAGYIGSHTVKEFKKRGYDIVVYDNLSIGHREFVPGGVMLVEGDLKDSGLLERTLLENNIDAVIHFAANAYVGESVANPIKYYTNNVASGINLLTAIVKCNVKKIVFSSSCATYGVPQRMPIAEDTAQMPINPYGRTKLMMEHIIRDYERAYGLKYAILRYFNAAGAAEDGSIGEWHEPETHAIPLIIGAATQKRKFTIFGNDYDTPDGTCIRDYVHVTDLATAHIKALEYIYENNASDCFNIGTGSGVSVRELIDVVERVVGKPVNYEIGERRPSDPAKLVASNAKATSVLNWRPQHSSIENIVCTAHRWHEKSAAKNLKKDS